MTKLLRVHEFAQLAGVTVKALHHYDRLGLLKPARSQAGYRLYTARDLERLEQIVALKFLGVPLRKIREVLDRSELELRDALRLQIAALEEKQQQLARTLRAVRTAESSIEPGQSAAPALLKRIIEAIEMQNDLEGMKKYFTEEAWGKQRLRYEHGPTPEWKALYQQASALVGVNPDSDPALVLARSWLEQLEADTGGDPAVLIGKTLAWEDREHWPPALKREITEYNLEAVYKFVGKAVLAHRKKHSGDDFWIRRDPRARASVAWYHIFSEVRIAMAAQTPFTAAQHVKGQWVDFLHRSTRVDPEVQARSVRAWEETQENHLARWSELAIDAEQCLGEQPGSRRCQELASSWMALWDCLLQGDLGVQVGFHTVRDIFNKEEVSELVGAALAWPLKPYFPGTAWDRLSERSRHVPMESLQQSTRAQIALYREVEGAIGEDRAGPTAQALAARWNALVHQEAAGDVEIDAGIRNAWRHRSNWPPSLREHVASLYLMDSETFENLSTFLDEAIAIHRAESDRAEGSANSADPLPCLLGPL